MRVIILDGGRLLSDDFELLFVAFAILRTPVTIEIGFCSEVANTVWANVCVEHLRHVGMKWDGQ